MHRDPHWDLYFDINLDDIPHQYHWEGGGSLRVPASPYLFRMLAEMSSEDAVMPRLGDLVRGAYSQLMKAVVEDRTIFHQKSVSVTTPMHELVGDKAVFTCPIIQPPAGGIVIANVMRAGGIPSYRLQEILTTTFGDACVRMDVLMMQRMAHKTTGAVTHVECPADKIDGDVAGKLVLIPDPMGATGGSMSDAVTLYKQKYSGFGATFVVMCLIVTPEFIRKMSTDHPDVHIFAGRIDRGMSPTDVLNCVPGERWDEESGLNDIHYIVPGAGGVGERLHGTKK